MRITILYNEPVLSADHPDYASEAGVVESVDAFAQALKNSGHHVAQLAITRSLVDLVQQLSIDRPDVVVNFCEGFAGRSRGEAYVTGLLELLEVPYTGSSPESLALVHDKWRTKQILMAAGVPTAPCWCLRRDDNLEQSDDAAHLREHLRRAPLFVKPAAEDASLGIDQHSVAVDWQALVRRVHELQSAYGDVLIESYIDGREFNVGVIALPQPRVLPIAEIAFEPCTDFSWPIVTYHSKWSTGSQAHRTTPVRCPATVEPDVAARVEQVALAAFQATGCRDYARVDIRLSLEGQLFVLEVNANPDAAPSAGLARALGVAGISYDEFAVRLVETAARRRCLTSPTPPEDLDTRQAHVRFRPLTASDHSALVNILAACQMFRPDEIQVADEILAEAIRGGASGHYQILVAEIDSRAVGWSCHGRVPLTDATYDLYWIAVHPDHQRQRIGRALLAEIESSLRRGGARWLLAETSSTAIYEKTRAFYERAGFNIVGEVRDFYRPTDGRITFGKRLD